MMEKSLRSRRRLRLALLGTRKHQPAAVVSTDAPPVPASPTPTDKHIHHAMMLLALNRWRYLLEALLLSLALLGVLFATQAPIFLYAYAPHTPKQGMIAIATLTIGMALLIPVLRYQFGLTAQALRTLPDPLYSLYLATLILVGSQSAVALAILTPFAAEIPSVIHFAYRGLIQRRYRSQAARERIGRVGAVHVMMLLRQAALGALITFLAVIVYAAATPLFQRVGHLSLLHAHLPAAFLSAATVLFCVSALRLARQTYETRRQLRGVTLSNPPADNWPVASLSPQATEKKPAQASVMSEIGANVRRYLASPTFRYQALLLSVCPLLPLVEVIDDVEAELAWALFLAPLCAVYYLALLSLSLQQRTNQLQQTVEALGASRQRQAELQGYAALVTQAQEDERRRLARELHDDTAQALVALARGLDTLSVGKQARKTSELEETAVSVSEAAMHEQQPGQNHTQDEREEQDARFIAELGAMARRALESVRRACRDLRPSVLDDLGLAAALEALCASMNQRGLPTEYAQTGEELSYPPTIEVAAYRIAQESLMNAYRHGRPTLARLTIHYQPERLRLEITDNGRGFDTQAHAHMALLKGGAPNAKTKEPANDVTDPHDIGPQTTTRSGLGVLGMRERAALIGATLSIKSARGRGTSVTLDVPLPHE